jgi:hypothetical protein
MARTRSWGGDEAAPASGAAAVPPPAGPGRFSVKHEFEGACVLLTGCTGYIGSLVLESLLRTTSVRRVHVLLRGKRGCGAQERCDRLLQGPIFHLVRDQPELLSKVRPPLLPCKTRQPGNRSRPGGGGGWLCCSLEGKRSPRNQSGRDPKARPARLRRLVCSYPRGPRLPTLTTPVRTRTQKPQALGTPARPQVVAVPGDLGRPRLGLSTSEVDALASEVDIIIHAAADIRLEAPIQETLHANYLGTRRVLELAMQLPRCARYPHARTPPRASRPHSFLLPSARGPGPTRPRVWPCPACPTVRSVPACSKCPPERT